MEGARETSGNTVDTTGENFTSGDRSQLIDGNGGQYTEANNATSSHEFSPLNLEAENSKRVTSEGLRVIIISSITFAVSVTIALILTIYLADPPIAPHAGVATEDAVCSDIGVDILKKGGSAVDTAIASTLCVGVISPHHSGIGGGGFMIIRLHKLNKTAVIDFRETAPSDASPHMYDNNEAMKRSGGLSVAVPGELRGLAEAHKKYGKLPWKKLVQPAADLAKKGFNVTANLAKAIRLDITDEDTALKEQFYRNGQPLQEGDFMTRPEYGAMLEKVAEQGIEAFYEGEGAQDIIDTVTSDNGIMKLDDLKGYKTVDREPIGTRMGDYLVETVSAPSGGPLVLLILNVMETYGFTNRTNFPLYFHRLVEAIKFSYGIGADLADPDFVPSAAQVAEMMANEEFARNLTELISDDETYPASHYSMGASAPQTGGTAHISVIGPHEDIVAVTSTINSRFGSKLVTKSGIILNNQMHDFSIPTSSDSSDLNAPEGGKRPLSHMAPAVIHKVNKNCGERMAIGGTNGTRIPTGVAEVILDHFGFGNNLTYSIARPRIHNPLTPDRIEYEDGIGEDVLQKLRDVGHTEFLENTEGINVVHAVLKINETVFAQSDNRIGGVAAAYY